MKMRGLTWSSLKHNASVSNGNANSQKEEYVKQFYYQADVKVSYENFLWTREMPKLIPLFAVLGFGVCGAIFYPLRCAVKSPDVSWNKTKNPEPWNEYIDKNYKFYQTDRIKNSNAVSPPKY